LLSQFVLRESELIAFEGKTTTVVETKMQRGCKIKFTFLDTGDNSGAVCFARVRAVDI
jgi:hypothetical protein